MLDLGLAPEVVRWATDRLMEAGMSEPRRVALGLSRDLEAAGDLSSVYRVAVLRLAAGEPYAYVVGQAGFRYLTLAVDARVLIPRPETEGLVDGVLARTRAGVALDVGTGSGCIALSLAQEGDFGAVLAVDASTPALAVASGNRRATGLAIDLVAGDLLAPFAPGSVDVLVANPPYLTFQEYRSLDGSVRAWEPGAALVSGSDGLAATMAIVGRGWDVVRPGGLLALEVDCRRAGAVARAAAAAGWDEIEVVRDVFDRDRYVFARKRGRS